MTWNGGDCERSNRASVSALNANDSGRNAQDFKKSVELVTVRLFNDGHLAAVVSDCLAVGPATQVHNKFCPNASDPAASRDHSPTIRVHPSALLPRSHPSASKSCNASRFLRVAPRQYRLGGDKPRAG